MDFAEAQGHIVPIALPAADRFAGGFTSSYVKLGDYAHATIVLFEGASAGAGRTLTVKEATSSTGAGATAIAFPYRVRTTSDTFGARTTATTAGIALTGSTTGRIVAIEVDSDVLSDGSPWVAFAVAESTAHAAVAASAVAVMTGVRYAQDTMRSAL